VTEPLHSRAARRRIRVLGAILWPSFLIAGVASMVFFASIDPETLRAQTLPGWDIERRTGYTIGFFMFWAVGAVSSALSLFLYRTAPRGSGDSADEVT
jgi:hypothetical protein